MRKPRVDRHAEIGAETAPETDARSRAFPRANHISTAMVFMAVRTRGPSRAGDGIPVGPLEFHGSATAPGPDHTFPDRTSQVVKFLTRNRYSFLR